MDEKEKDQLDPENDFEICQEMEQTFAKVVAELVSDRSLDRFRKEYESLHDALVQSHEHNTVLMEKCRTLNQDIITNASKISSVLQLSQNDQRTIANLRGEFEKAWKLVQLSQDREAKSNEVIFNLNQEITNLKYLVENAKRPNDESIPVSLQDVQNEVNSLKNDIEVQNDQSAQLRNQLDETMKSTMKMEYETRNLKDEYEVLISEKEDVDLDFSKIESERIKILDSCYEQSENIKAENARSNEINQQIKEQKAKIRGQKRVIQQCQKDKDMLNELTAQVRVRLRNLKKRYDDVKALTKGTASRIKEKSNIIKDSEDKIYDFLTEIEAIDYENEDIQNELEECKEYRKLVVTTKESDFKRLKELRQEELILRTKFNSLLLDIRKSDIDVSRNNNENRNLQQRVFNEKNETDIVEMQTHQIEHQYTQIKNIKHEGGKKLSTFCEEINKYEAEKFAQDSAAALERDNNVELKRQIEYLDVKLEQKGHEIKQNEIFMKDIQEERDRLVKEVRKVCKENEEIENEIKSQSNQLSSLKEGIREKDESCVLLHISLKKTIKLLKELNIKKEEIKEHLRESLEKGKLVYYNVLSHEHIHDQALKDIESSKHLIQKILNQNRDIVHIFETKKKESDAAFEKTRVLQSLSRIGGHKYEQMVEKVHSLENELSLFVQKQEELILALRGQNAARREIKRLERCILDSQGQIKAMEDELETPRNVHRWHLLKSTNPIHYDLVILRMQLINNITEHIALSKRLKSRTFVLKEQLDKENRKLKNSYGGRYDEEYQTLSVILKEKTKKLKTMEETRISRKDQVEDEIDQVKSVRCMIRAKRRKTVEQQKKINELVQISEPEKIHPPKFNYTKRAPGRFMGGGFEVGRVVNELIPPVEVKKTRKKSVSERLNALLVPTASSAAKKVTRNQNWAPSKNSSRRQMSLRAHRDYM
ncbi:coiled-coil domain containing 147 [Tritrichomonas foetus]|uniref:Coiled-coil domain containing 147 n=1 Tax=Tritrichomonas foetus TaxID=1144522 RepID=A0A1J4KPN5_9EUKA|nr:coiled-coil domain containing 147 [Tritrichomonas foetus]|eukprot:OHT13203.1 coiled-coil domain containing 147 [Tritrichomonas foetus]